MILTNSLSQHSRSVILLVLLSQATIRLPLPAQPRPQQPATTPQPVEIRTQNVQLANQKEATNITVLLKAAAAVKDSVVFGLLVANIKEDEIVLTGTAAQIKHAQDIIKALDQPSALPPPRPEVAGQRVKLYYLREAAKIKTILTSVAAEETSSLHGLVVADVVGDELILYGSPEQRRNASRIIAALDLPRPGVRLEMWGIQLSSNEPTSLDAVMRLIRAETDRTQEAVRATYTTLQRISSQVVVDKDLDSKFKELLQKTLLFQSALESNRPLSFTDILLRLLAAKKPHVAAKKLADSFSQAVDKIVKARFDPSTEKLKESLGCKSRKTAFEKIHLPQRQPFERFFRTRGLAYQQNVWVAPVKDDPAQDDPVTINTKLGRSTLLNFALQYGQLVHDPDSFSPYYLQRAADTLNTRLQENIDAFNLDIQELFVTPTLDRIREIVSCFKDVEFAQVGKTGISTLSGITTEVSAHSVSAFDVTPPLPLSELLKKADALATGADEFIPNVKKTGAEQVVGTVPLARVIGLLAAFGEDRAVWRELKAGISFTVTPNVLRTMTSAELQINLQTGDPKVSTQETGVRPLSRVSQHDLKTNIYLNALDFFDLSAFVSQSTMDGGRGYVPLLGTIWMGLFSDVPVAGKLFSWKKGPKTVYHQSLVLTNSFISPTAMGIAALYPTSTQNGQKMQPPTFAEQLQAVEDYNKQLKTMNFER